MEYLVTGCTGFIGAQFIDLLLRKGHHVCCISRAEACPNRGRVKHVQHDLSNRLDYDLLPTRLDGIIHSAACMGKGRGPYDMFRINTVSTLDLLEYGGRAKTKRFIFISSGGVYGYRDTPSSEKSPIRPVDFYGQTKYQSELLVHQYDPHFISTVILRLFFPYGPGQNRGLVPLLISCIQNERPITLYNGGAPQINPIYITDLLEATAQSLTLEGPYTFNLCGDEVTNIKELSLLIAGHLKREPLFVFEKNTTISNLIGENSLMKETLGVAPTISLKQGLATVLQKLRD